MKNLETNAGMTIMGQHVMEDLSPRTRIGSDRVTWNLDRIASIVTATTLADAQARADAVRRARTRNTMMGAALGGLADAASGDDGIADGILLGAAFGYVMSPGPETPVARIGVVFADGQALALEVDEREYTLLQTAARRALALSAGRTEVGPVTTRRPMRCDEAEDILNQRGYRSAFRNVILICVSGAFAVILGRFGVALTGDALMATLTDAMMYLMIVGCIVVFFVSRSPRQHLRGDEEAWFDRAARSEMGGTVQP